MKRQDKTIHRLNTSNKIQIQGQKKSKDKDTHSLITSGIPTVSLGRRSFALFQAPFNMIRLKRGCNMMKRWKLSLRMWMWCIQHTLIQGIFTYSGKLWNFQKWECFVYNKNEQVWKPACPPWARRYFLLDPLRLRKINVINDGSWKCGICLHP